MMSQCASFESLLHTLLYLRAPLTFKILTLETAKSKSRCAVVHSRLDFGPTALLLCVSAANMI